CALGTGILLGWLLIFGPLNPHATWAQLEAPPQAVAGAPFPVRVRIEASPSGRFVTVDLHARGPGKTARRVLLSAPPQPVPSPNDWLDFPFTIPGTTDVTSLICVVYLSSNGAWANHLDAAHSRPIPLAQASPGSPAASPRRLPLLPLTPPTNAPAAGSLSLRLAGCALVMFAAWRLHRRTPGLPLPAHASPRHTHFDSARRWTLALGLGALTIALQLDLVLTSVARGIATSLDLYDRRQSLQMVLAVLCIAALVAWVPLVLRAPAGAGVGRGIRVAFIAWLGLYALGAVSLHGIDDLNAKIWGNITRFDLLPFSLALATALLATLTDRPQPA
ncbi:MAG: hypothetical protein IT580_18240, partial [Verrucomicrobiales bacterium]|nr:hypothetical protein [Verrucomicrobiales bacterium]